MGQAMSELKVNVIGSSGFLGWSRQLEPKFLLEVPPAEGTKQIDCLSISADVHRPQHASGPEWDL